MEENSKLGKIKKYKTHLIRALVLSIFLSLVTTIFFRYSNRILSSFGENTLSTIFAQLKESDIKTPFLIPFVCFFFLTFWILKFDYNKNRFLKWLLGLCLYVVSFGVLLVFSILLSKVNGILFVDVLVSLLENMEGLGL